MSRSGRRGERRGGEVTFVETLNGVRVPNLRLGLRIHACLDYARANSSLSLSGQILWGGMSYQSTGICLDKFRYALLCILFIVFSVLKAESAMALGRVECGELLPITLESLTKLNDNIFIAKITDTTDAGVIKLRRGDFLLYYKINIEIEEILKSSKRQIKIGWRTSAVIFNEDPSGRGKILNRDFFNGDSVIFIIDNDKYTVSGYDDYDKEIYRKIASKIKVDHADRRYIVALPCQHYEYTGVFGYNRDIIGEIRAYIGQRR